MPTRKGAVRLFRVAGITVFLHWSWFIVAVIEISTRKKTYSSPVWNVVEYLALFAIVTMHEFGHAFACRSVGGKADEIVLWPLGGVAYVRPPDRPGAWLWSIAAGPLVNVALLPVFGGLLFLSGQQGWRASFPQMYELIRALFFMDVGMLAFNLLPIHPLDGGQILRALLWYFVGRARSLLITALIGFVGAAGILALAVGIGSGWLGVMSVFVALGCVGGLARARALARAETAPRRSGFACPACRFSPPEGAFWYCRRCRKTFDSFATNGACPTCAVKYPTTNCFDCGYGAPAEAWTVSAAPASLAAPEIPAAG
jgi:Zn-dependent protease